MKNEWNNLRWSSSSSPSLGQKELYLRSHSRTSRTLEPLMRERCRVTGEILFFPPQGTSFKSQQLWVLPTTHSLGWGWLPSWTRSIISHSLVITLTWVCLSSLASQSSSPFHQPSCFPPFPTLCVCMIFLGAKINPTMTFNYDLH